VAELARIAERYRNNSYLGGAFSTVSVVKLSSSNFRQRICTSAPVHGHTYTHVHARLVLCNVAKLWSLYSDESQWLGNTRTIYNVRR